MLWTVVLGRLLRVPWTARRSSHSILNEINLTIHWKDWCWSFNTLTTWCEEPTHWKRSSCWERLKAKGEGNDRGWDHQLDGPEFKQTLGESGGQRSLECCSLWCLKRHNLGNEKQLAHTSWWPWASYSTILCLSFLIHKMGRRLSCSLPL